MKERTCVRDPDPDAWRYGQPPGRDWDDELDDGYGYGRPEPEESHTLLCTVIGCAVGALLAAVPLFGLPRRRDELLELGAAIGGLVGVCKDAARPRRARRR